MLLERARELSLLGACLARVRDGSRGELVLVGGEAGVGKTALLRAFCRDERRLLWGACDALFTPRPLGPLLDIADEVGGELAALVDTDARPYEVASALLRDLRTREPTILVLEDLHNGDEATLDVLRLLARRLETLPALVLANRCGARSRSCSDSAPPRLRPWSCSGCESSESGGFPAARGARRRTTRRD